MVAKHGFETVLTRFMQFLVLLTTLQTIL